MERNITERKKNDKIDYLHESFKLRKLRSIISISLNHPYFIIFEITVTIPT